jgi:hypothetical protein
MKSLAEDPATKARRPLPAHHIASEVQVMNLGPRFAIQHQLTGPDPKGRCRCLTLHDGAQSAMPVACGADEASVVIAEVWDRLDP